MPGRSTNDPANYIAIAKQSARDTEGTTFYYLKHLDGSGFDIDPEIQRVREGGAGQEIGLSWRKMVKGDGNLVAYARPEVAARVLEGILGFDTPSVVSSPLTDHTLTPTSAAPYYTIDQAWADEQERTTNAKFTSLDIEFEGGMPLKLTAGFISGGTTYRPTQLLTATRESSKPLYYPLASIALTGGASGIRVTKGKASIKRALDDTIQTTGLNRADVVEQNFDADVDLTVEYESAALWRSAHYNGGSTVLQDLATTSLSIFSQQGSQSLRIDWPLLEIIGAKVNRLDPDGKTMFVDIALSSVKGATHPVWARVRNVATVL